jgi:hypothetical protein
VVALSAVIVGAGSMVGRTTVAVPPVGVLSTDADKIGMRALSRKSARF